VSHARQQIREKVAAILTTANAAAVISQSRVYPLPPNSTTVALIYTNLETVFETTLTSPRKLTRELTLVIEAVARKVNDLDDQLDSLCQVIENAIGNNNTLDGLVKDCILTDTTITHDFSGDAPIGNARMQFRVLYRTAENVSQTLIV
jgi:hypothetical protein